MTIDPRKTKPQAAEDWLELVGQLGTELMAEVDACGAIDGDKFLRKMKFMILFARGAGALDHVNSFRGVSEAERQRFRDQVCLGVGDVWVAMMEGHKPPEPDMTKYPFGPGGPES